MANEDSDLHTEIQQGKHIHDTDMVMRQLEAINWIIANVTTPANYFHIIRRQLALPFRKPLIIMSPKSLLRSSECRSEFRDMLLGKIIINEEEFNVLFLFMFLFRYKF